QPPAVASVANDARQRTARAHLAGAAPIIGRMVDMEPPTSNAGTARLLVQCADRPGIVAAVSRFLYEHGANIVQADQYSSAGGYGRFFMRSEFELGGLDVPPEELERLFED